MRATVQLTGDLSTRLERLLRESSWLAGLAGNLPHDAGNLK
jgi:hypothetical protein